MAANSALLTLRTGVRDLGEFRGDATKGPHTDAQINADINRSIGVWFAELVEVAPEALDETLDTIAVSPGSGNVYNLAADYYKTSQVLVDDTSSATLFRHLERIEWRERHLYGGSNSDPKSSRYVVRGTSIYFVPNVQWTANVYHHYHATPTALSLDGDTFDFVVPGAGEQWCIYDVCIRRGTKEEQKINEWKVLRDEMWQRLSSYAQRRDHARPRRVADFQGSYDPMYLDRDRYRWRF